MELLGKISLVLHIAAGCLTLLTGPIAIFYNFKDPRQHRRFGKVFFYAMLVVTASAIGGYFKRPDEIFLQMLLGISLIVLFGSLRAVRSIFLMKGGKVNKLDWTYTILLAVTGFWMVKMSFGAYLGGNHIAFVILFGIFGVTSLGEAYKNYQVFTHPEKLSRIDWMLLHASTMLGAFTASTTAFTVNAAHFLPWWAQWFGPTILLVPFQFYFARKIKGLRKPVLSPQS